MGVLEITGGSYYADSNFIVIEEPVNDDESRTPNESEESGTTRTNSTNQGLGITGD